MRIRSKKACYDTEDLLWHLYFKDRLQSRPASCHTSLAQLSGAAPVVSPQAENAADKNDRVAALLANQDHSTFQTLFKACSRKKDLFRGTILHADALKRGLLDASSYVVDALVTMYAKCGMLAKAEDLLVGLPVRDVFCWTQLMTSYAQNGHGQDALNCFERMLHEGVSPDAVTFSCILKACGSIGALDKGEQIHDEIARQGLLRNNVVLGTALIDMYAKCGALAKAQQALDDLPARDAFSWSALIAGYAQNGKGEEALKCFERMQGDGLSPDAVTFICILKACCSLGAADKGEQVHDEIVKQGLLRKSVTLGTALVDMYAKCGALAKAQGVLDELLVRDVVTWSALIAGYAQHGQGQDALKCFEQMQREGFTPNAITYTSILKACGSIAAVDKGEQIHHEIARQGLLQNNIVLGTALVDMYAKCGALAKAQQVLEDLPVGDVVSWSALITGYAQQGSGEEALKCFQRMQEKGLSPDTITFSCLLNACNQSGLVEEGQKFFADMTDKFGLRPDSEHYTCMIDLLGHTGHLDKAVAMIQRMPSSNYSAVWSVLLESCRKWGDVKVGRWAFEHAVQVDKSDVAPYFCMANIYAAAGMEKDAKSVEAMRWENIAVRRQGAIVG